MKNNAAFNNNVSDIAEVYDRVWIEFPTVFLIMLSGGIQKYTSNGRNMHKNTCFLATSDGSANPFSLNVQVAVAFTASRRHRPQPLDPFSCVHINVHSEANRLLACRSVLPLTEIHWSASESLCLKGDFKSNYAHARKCGWKGQTTEDPKKRLHQCVCWTTTTFIYKKGLQSFFTVSCFSVRNECISTNKSEIDIEIWTSNEFKDTLQCQYNTICFKIYVLFCESNS